MFTGFVKCDCNGVCVEVNPFICTTSTTSTTTSTSSTTTTTTTALCNRWQYAYDVLTCELCEFVESSFLYNSNPLTLFNFYQLGEFVISPYEYLGCDVGESDTSIPDEGFATCEEILCTTTTTKPPVTCNIYGLQATVIEGGSWSALDCLGEAVGGLLTSGDTTYTPCIDIATLEIIDGEIKEIIEC